MVGSLICAGFLLMLPSQGVAHLNDAPAISPAPAAGALPADGLFFADVVVRGKVVFQVGSLSNLSASDRAAIINRRIASLVSQSPVNRSIAVTSDPKRGIVTLLLAIEMIQPGYPQAI